MPDNTGSESKKGDLSGVSASSSPSPDDDKEVSSITLSYDDDDVNSSKHSIKTQERLDTIQNNQYDDTEDMDEDNDQNIKENSLKLESPLKRLRKSEDDEASDVKDKFILKISNFPSSWDFSKVHGFLLKECGPVNVVYMAGDENPCCVLEFTSLNDCRKAWNALHDKALEDDKLTAEIRDSYTGDSDDETSPPKKKKRSKKLWRPDIDVWDKDPRGLYGFKKEYLESLGIAPPVDRWVHVSNFRCDKHELKEALELAGEVLLCCVDNRGTKTANVMYSHPLEAVQAVSMLNNQQFYGQALKVSIQVCTPGTIFLPKGLSAVGPGLGNNGIPLRDIVKQFERFVTNKSSLVNTSVFSTPDILSGGDADEVDVYVSKTLSETQAEDSGSEKELDKSPESSSSPTQPTKTTITPKSSNGSLCSPTKPGFIINNPVNSIIAPVSPVSGPPGLVSGPKSVGLLSSPPRPMGPNVGPMYPNPVVMGPRPVGPILLSLQPMGPARTTILPNPIAIGLNPRLISPIGPKPGLINPLGGSTFGPGPRPGFNGPQSVAGPVSGPMRLTAQPSGANEYVTVELANLPLSTTFPLLCEKMAECGQVISIQLTAPGCAVVQFAQRLQAERCFQLYNNCCILGNLIKVKFL